jgi:hypothetical protein
MSIFACTVGYICRMALRLSGLYYVSVVADDIGFDIVKIDVFAQSRTL